MRDLFSETEVGEVGRRGLLGFAASTTACEVFAEVLAKGACVPGANHAEDGGDLACRLAFAHHCEGNFGRANLSRLLRGAEKEVVERLTRLGECEQKCALLGDLAVGLHGGRGAFGAGSGFFVRGHRIILSFYRLGRSGGIALPCLYNGRGLRLSNPYLHFRANLSFVKSLTLLIVNIVAQAQAGARTTKQLRAGAWIRRIHSVEQIHKLNTLMYLAAGCGS